MRTRKVACLFFVALNACATQTVTFKSEGPSSVNVVDWNDLDSQAQPLGKTPLTVKVSDLQGKVVRISQPKRAPQFWVVSCDASREHLEAKVKLAELPTVEVPGEAPKKVAIEELKQAAPTCTNASLNESHRLLLRSYEALANGDDALATDIAEKLAIQAPGLASPLVVAGLSYLRRGEREKARVSFTRAAQLDPADLGISELVKLTRQ